MSKRTARVDKTESKADSKTDRNDPSGWADLTPGQLEIMEVIWAAGEAGVAQVWKALGERRVVARNTVQTMLARLHERGWLTAREEGNAFVYAAARPRHSAVASLVGTLGHGLLDRVFGGSLSGLVSAIVEDRPLPAAEAARLRAIIDAAEESTPGGGRPSGGRRGGGAR